ncbi:MAG: hypothetical protein R2734_09275 [Nocardioides sp.]
MSHNAAYRHFSHRDELLAEIASVAADRLEAAMRRRLDELEEPDHVGWPNRLAEVGRAYVEFALAEPGLFAVAFSDAGPGHAQAGSAHRRPRSRSTPAPPPARRVPGRPGRRRGHAGGSSRRERCRLLGGGPRLRRALLSGPLRELPAVERGPALDDAAGDRAARAGGARVAP